MHTVLNEARLKSGEMLHVGCVLGPEPSQVERVEPFLSHKSGPWFWHIGKALREPLDTLETRFYLGEIDGQIVGNVCTFEEGGIGILGHVFTLPEHRQKGIASALFDVLMDDFRERGGRLLTLGTGYDSPAYHIYRRYGFESARPESGEMIYSIPSFERDSLFEPANVSARPATWGDWPHLNLLFMRQGEPLLRNLAYGAFGLTNIEGTYLRIQKDREDGRLHGAWILETMARVPVGFATITKSSQWPGPLWQLDLCFHPQFESAAPVLLNAIDWPEGKVQTYAERGEKPLFGALLNWGFRNEGHLEKQLRVKDEVGDITLWAKGA